MGEVDIVVWVLGYWGEKIEQGVGHITPKLLTPSPHNHNCPPIKTKDRGCGGCLVGEEDTVVWVLGYQDKKIERGVGHFTPKLLILSAPNHYRPLVETASSGHEGSTWAKVGGVVVMLAGHTGKPCRGLQN